MKFQLQNAEEKNVLAKNFSQMLINVGLTLA